MMFVQPELWIEKNDSSINKILKRRNDGRLKDIAKEEHCIFDYKSTKRGAPKPFTSHNISTSDTNIQAKMIAHAIARLSNDGCDVLPNEQCIGAFSGFMASISPAEERSKPYFYTTLPRPPSKKVVYTLMLKAVDVAEKKKMPFIQFVGDQPVFTLIVELKAENPEVFVRIVPVLGPFHTQMAFMSAIYKRFQESGIEDVLVTAGLIAEGSVQQALKGKHYNRALRIYKLLYEALVRLLIRSGSEHGITIPNDINFMIEIIRNLELDAVDRLFTFEQLTEDEQFNLFIKKLFKQFSMPDHHLFKYMASLMEMIEILFLNIDSIRTHNLDNFLSSIRLMMPWMKAYDCSNYGRWLPVYWEGMKSLPPEHKFMMEKIFAQSLTTNPYSAQPPDMWIEVTMNKGSKIKSGWKRTLYSEKGLFVQVKNSNNVNALRNCMKTFLNETKRIHHVHKENVSSRLKADEKAVQDLVDLLIEWQCNPFDSTSQELRSLQAGALASEQLVNDFESAHEFGEKMVAAFFRERIFSSNVSIYERISKNKRKSFHTMNIISKKSANNVLDMENKAIVSMIELVRKEKPELFKEIWNYRISEHNLSVFNSNGTMRKCQKSKLMEELNFVGSYVTDYVAILDMGLIWHLTMPSAEDRDKSENEIFTWHDYANKVYSRIIERHERATVIILCNDYYGDDIVNIKDGEHADRAKKFIGGDSANMYPQSTKEFPSCNQFKKFFRNKGNKRRLQEFLKTELSKFAFKDSRKMIYCTRNDCNEISTVPFKAIPEFCCDHIEADTAIFYVYSEIRKADSEIPVVIDSEDSDVVALSASVSQRISGDLFIKRKKGNFICSKLCNEEMKNIIVRAYVMSGNDSVESFYGVGKKTIWKNVLRNKEARDLLCDLSDEALIKFVIKYVYNDKKSTTLAEMREARWTKMKKKSLSRVGIDTDTCLQRNQRVRYQVKLLENFDQSTLECCPLTSGYQMSQNSCTPLRYTKPALPSQLVNFHESSEFERHEMADRENDAFSESEDDSDDGDLDDEGEHFEIDSDVDI